jgi:hypothetical protein
MHPGVIALASRAVGRALHRVGYFTARHKWTTFGAWLVFVAALVALSHVSR